MSNIICFDTETTGINPKNGDEMLSLSIINGNGDVLFNKLFFPSVQKNIDYGWPEAEAVNHISFNDVKNCHPFSYYKEEVQKIFDDADTIIGFNTAFDLDMVHAGGIILPKPVYPFDDLGRFCGYKKGVTKCARKGKNIVIHDVMRAYSEFHGGKWPKLVTLAEKYKYNWEGSAHDALFDTKATLYCHYKLQDEIEQASKLTTGYQLRF